MDNGQDDKKPLTTGQIAQYCHVTHRGVLKWVESGKLKAYRTPGKHSRVSVEDFLQFLKEYNMPVPQELQAQTPVKRKILIVDDDRGMISSLRRVLMLQDKYIIEAAFDGFHAGKIFADFKPDLIILDICMPGLDGYQVCQNIRRGPENKQVKILAISGLSESHEVKKIMEMGANDYLQKPFSNAALQQKIEGLWRQP